MKAHKSGMPRDLQRRHGGTSLKRGYEGPQPSQDGKIGERNQMEEKEVVIVHEFYKKFPDDFDDTDLS